MSLVADSSLSDVARRIRDGELTSVEVVQACLERIAAGNSALNAFVLVFAEDALDAAEIADLRRRSEGNSGRPLDGVPVAVKDAFRIPGTVTAIGETSLANYYPPGPEASSVRLLREAGAIVLGKTSVGSGMRHDEAGRFGAARNPWDSARTAGGSSSGSAAAVATGMAYGALGTDTGGSIRNPASFCGVVGLKPTYGLVSLEGDIYGVGTRLEHVGPIARTVEDVEMLLGAVRSRGRTSLRGRGGAPADRPRGGTIGGTLGAAKIAVAAGGGVVRAEPDVLKCVDRAAELLSDSGLDVSRVDLPYCDEETFYLLTLADSWAQYDEATDQPDVYLSYIKRWLGGRVRRLQGYAERMAAPTLEFYDSLFRSFDLLVLATAPITARPFGELTTECAGATSATFDLHQINTWMFNLTGQPAISVPVGFDTQGLPVGIQIVGRHFEEPLLLEAAAWLEHERGPLPLPPSLAL